MTMPPICKKKNHENNELPPKLGAADLAKPDSAGLTICPASCRILIRSLANFAFECVKKVKAVPLAPARPVRPIL